MNLPAEIKPGMPVTPELEIVRLFDSGIIDSLFKHDGIYPISCDDYSSSPEGFSTEEVVNNESIYFLGGFVDDSLAGIFFYHPHNRIMYEVHSAVIPEFRGSNTCRMAKDSILWMFSNTECLKIITHVPVYNRPAYALARKAGMTVEGVNRNSFMKNGVLVDQTLLGITKEESTCQYQQ